MAEPVFNRLCLVGIGLIGSSIARVARKRGDIARTVVATARRPETLARVRELGHPVNLHGARGEKRPASDAELLQHARETWSRLRDPASADGRLLRQLGIMP